MATEVLIYGHPKSKATRKAQRWFSDRRIPVAFHDLRKDELAPGTVRRWVQRFGVEALLDKEGSTYTGGGWSYRRMSDDDWLPRLAAEPGLLLLPLVRCGGELGVGDDEVAWARLATAAKE